MASLKSLIVIILLGSSLQAQIKRNNISRASREIFPFSGEIINGDLYISTLLRGQNDTLSNLLIYDTINLQLIDSISPSYTGRNHVHFRGVFTFNNKNYVLATPNDVSKYGWSVHQIQGTKLVDSISLGLDTLLRPFVGKIEPISVNQLRLHVYTMAPNHFIILNTRIIDLDSNFNITNYHVIDPRKLNFPKRTTATFHVHEVNNNLWHVFNSHVIHFYNPTQKTVDSTFYFSKEIRASVRINSSEYLAIGEVASGKDFMGFPASATTGLGFYRMNSSATIKDTVVYFAKTKVQNPNFTLHSDPNLYSSSFLYSDTNNIYLSCSNSFSGIVGDPPEGYILVIKTDSRGGEKWRYLWGAPNLNAAIYQILPTKEEGCIIVGAFQYTGGNSIGTIIKLGPDGTISNVEVDAPENLVAFYPNPIKEKLHFDYLPEANGQYTLEVMDMNGKPVLETSLDEEKGFLPVQLKTGFYIYQLKDEAGKVVQVGKVVAE